MADYLQRLKGYKDFTSPENAHGLHMQFTKSDRGVTSTFTIPPHMSGWRGKEVVAAHPGVVDVALNTTMGWAAASHLNMAGLQKSVSVEYLDLVPVERKLHCVGRVIRQRQDEEAVVEGEIVDEHSNILAKGVATFAMFAVEKIDGASRTFHALQAGACNPRFLE